MWYVIFNPFHQILRFMPTHIWFTLYFKSLVVAFQPVFKPQINIGILQNSFAHAFHTLMYVSIRVNLWSTSNSNNNSYPSQRKCLFISWILTQHWTMQPHMHHTGMVKINTNPTIFSLRKTPKMKITDIFLSTFRTSAISLALYFCYENINVGKVWGLECPIVDITFKLPTRKYCYIDHNNDTSFTVAIFIATLTKSVDVQIDYDAPYTLNEILSGVCALTLIKEMRFKKLLLCHQFSSRQHDLYLRFSR